MELIVIMMMELMMMIKYSTDVFSDELIDFENMGVAVENLKLSSMHAEL